MTTLESKIASISFPNTGNMVDVTLDNGRKFSTTLSALVKDILNDEVKKETK